MTNYFGVDVRLINTTRIVDLENIEKYKPGKRAKKRMLDLKPKQAPTKIVSVSKAAFKNKTFEQIEVYDQSKKLVRFEFVEEGERSPLYNLVYPKEMKINQ